MQSNRKIPLMRRQSCHVVTTSPVANNASTIASVAATPHASPALLSLSSGRGNNAEEDEVDDEDGADSDDDDSDASNSSEADTSDSEVNQSRN